ncbi:hypothetical protein JOC76_006172 [Neobacillus cucumis]|nr:hypothetical protein [Neobacillus cucumis]MBM7656560.1 hypothetical protein [Neobacillus cucumis]
MPQRQATYHIVGRTDIDSKGNELMRSPSAHVRKALRTYLLVMY